MMNIVFVCNNKYFDKLLVAIKSLIHNNFKNIDLLNIVVRTDDLDVNSIEIIKKELLKYNFPYEHFSVIYENILLDKIKTVNKAAFKGNYLAYLSIIGLDTIFQYEERALVLDVDILVMDSLQELYECNLNGNTAAAVLENGSEYNTGVVLWDMNKYRDTHTSDKFMDTLENMEQECITLGDQSVFNHFCWNVDNFCMALHPRFNLIISQRALTYKQYISMKGSLGYYEEQVYMEAKKNPAIYHCINGFFCISPWFYESDIELREIWDSYMIDTDYQPLFNRTHVNRNHWIIYQILKIVRGLPEEISCVILRRLYQLI